MKSYDIIILIIFLIVLTCFLHYVLPFINNILDGKEGMAVKQYKI